ncbi:MAG: glycoside hydrolase family 3 C-terminal domain-containing protein, partial [Halovenus sp.]
MAGDTISRLLETLTRGEKLGLVRGAADPAGTATGYVAGIERLGIPPLRLVDGPLGVRIPDESATAFPAPIAVASTFDPTAAYRKGAAMAREAAAHGQDVLLAPGLNLIRIPHCGRNFEYYSEDPILTGSIAASAVEGIQSEEVLATPKHYVANNQETDRVTVSADSSERTLRERYLPGFHDAVDAGAGAIMTAYNRVNGTHMSEHRELVTGVLKEEWGFDGVVMSDWYGTESTVAAANAGLDLEMPGIEPDEQIGGAADEETADQTTDFGALAGGMPDPENVGQFDQALSEAIDSGAVPESRLDEMVRRVLGAIERLDRLDGDRPVGELDTPDHRTLAEELAARGTVVLENDGVLPLAAETEIAVIGPNVHEATLGGGGSSETTPFVTTSTAAGLRDRADGAVTVCRGHPEIEDLSFFDVIAGESTGRTDENKIETEFDSAADAAAGAEVAIVVVRDRATEAKDRESLALPGEQDGLVEAVAAANDRTVVVIQSSGPVETPWRDSVAAVVEAWYPGQADGAALASVLYGDIDASGRLPVTFAPAAAYPASSPEQYPGVAGRASYSEGVFVGYHHFDASGTDPTYPFGHGCSYATFAYRDLTVTDEGAVELTVENTGDRDGREVVQAYVCPPESDIERPERELGGFAAVDVAGGASERVRIDLDDRAFSYYDDGWVLESGEYTVEVGRSA